MYLVHHYLGFILSFIVPPKLIQKIRDKKYFLQSLYFRRFFKSFGNFSMLFTSKIENPCYMEIGDEVVVGEDTLLSAIDVWNGKKYNPHLVLGDKCYIGNYNKITCCNSVIIKSGVVTGQYVLITDNAHGKNSYDDLRKGVYERDLYSKGPVIIEKNVWIGEKAVILPGVHIGEGAVIGANAVVNKDVPDFALAVGIPARIISKKNE